MIDKFETMLKNMDTTYKMFLLKHLIVEVSKGSECFSFFELACGIVASAWDIINIKAKKFTHHDKLFDIFTDIYYKKDGIDNYSSFEEVYNYLLDCKHSDVIKQLNNIVAYAPYRLIIDENLSILIKGVPDKKKNSIIEQYSKNNIDSFYVISNKNIKIRKQYVDYIRLNSRMLTKWINSKIDEELR